jgi:hypothetical protein
MVGVQKKSPGRYRLLLLFSGDANFDPGPEGAGFFHMSLHVSWSTKFHFASGIILTF